MNVGGLCYDTAMNEILKILLVQTMNMNLGDSVLSDCDEYLLRRCLGKREYQIFRYSIASRDVDQVRYVDAVIFAGGIFKVTNEKFWLYIPEILEEAEKQQVPVFFSAIGVEAFYPDDERSVALRDALNLPCVKGISARDDVDTLRRDYITNPNIRITSVYDPAVWCRDVYREALEQREMPAEKTVGVGIVRHKLFEDYGHPEVTREDQMRFWQGVIEELELRGLPWKIFTNGDRYDELFADEVLQAVGHGEKAPAPLDSADLVRMIGEFSGVIAGRMHSNIVAYALGIPAIGIIWNQKLRFWGRKTGHPERLFETDKMDPAGMVNALQKAMKQHAKPSYFKKRSVYKAMNDFVQKYCVIRPDRVHEELPVHDRMVATALGGIDKRYRNTNSREAFQYSIARGYRNFEVDLRLTSDGVLVCVNRWHSDTYQMFNLPVEEEGAAPPLSLEEFLEARCYQRFPTMTFREFAALASPCFSREGYRLIISFGRPSAEELPLMLARLKEELAKGRLDPKQLLLRLERRKDIAAVKAAGTGIPVIYYIVPPKEPEGTDPIPFIRDALDYCGKQKIAFAALSETYFHEEAAALFREAGVQPVVFTYVKAGRILQAIRDGAFAASHFYDADYIADLIR